MLAISTIGDIAFVIPEPARGLIWQPSVYSATGEVRERLCRFVLDCFRAHTNDNSPEGPKPLELNCWDIKTAMPTEAIPNAYPPSEYITERDAAGLALVNQDVTAFDAFAALQLWSRRHATQFVQRQAWAKDQPYTHGDISTIASVAAVLT